MLPVSGHRDLDRALKSGFSLLHGVWGPSWENTKSETIPQPLFTPRTGTWASMSGTLGLLTRVIQVASLCLRSHTAWQSQASLMTEWPQAGLQVLQQHKAETTSPLRTQPQESNSIIHPMMVQVVTSLIRWDCQKEGSVPKNKESMP